MNKKYLMAASMIILACACQSKSDNMQDDSKNKQQQKPSGGCCEMEKPQQVAPLSEPASAVVAPPADQISAIAPEVKAETKTP